MSKGLIIIGAGGHGKVVLDAALLMKNWEHVIFVDKDPELKSLFGFNVVNELSEIPQNKLWDIVVAIGNNLTRLSLSQSMLDEGYHLASIIHPSAIVSQWADIGSGTVIFANAVVNAGTSIGVANIINTAATIDHDCQIADGVHISPGANLAGMVKVAKCSWIGIGASIIQMMSIGENSIVGAGAVVLKNISHNTIVAGVPAKFIVKS